MQQNVILDKIKKNKYQEAVNSAQILLTQCLQGRGFASVKALRVYQNKCWLFFYFNSALAHHNASARLFTRNIARVSFCVRYNWLQRTKSWVAVYPPPPIIALCTFVALLGTRFWRGNAICLIKIWSMVENSTFFIRSTFVIRVEIQFQLLIS